MKRRLGKIIYKIFKNYIRFEFWKSPINMCVYLSVYVFDEKIKEIKWSEIELMEML